MKLSIIIVNWNTCAITLQCLRTVFGFQSKYDFEVILVDNGSIDDSVEKITSEFPHVQILQNPKNLGFARANNQAIQLSRGELVLLLNSDTELKPDAINNLVDFLELNATAGAGGPLLLNPDGSVQLSCFPFPTLGREFWRLFHLDIIWPLGVYRMNEWDMFHPRQVDTIQGACLIVRREVFEKIGLLDEDYYFYTEEIDFCFRLNKAGWQNWWIPKAHVTHYGGQSSRLVAEESFLRLYKTKIIYFRKHYHWPVPQIYKLIVLMASLIRVVLSIFLYIVPFPGRDRFRTIARYYRHLVLELPGL